MHAGLWQRLIDGLVPEAAAAATGGGGGEPSFLIQLAPFFLVFVIIYFLMIRPQQKKSQEHRAMLEALKPGDNVIAGGIFGEIAKIKDDVVTLKIAENVRIRVHRSAISSKTAAEADKPQGAS
ncbi:MAG: preprotein translocase subunit YajC [Candidatus Tectomicrobia bacterium]|uniref:Sec translocon accessory complex subunit YajC n=1 Tax=Tectimicrobiota bacterium TaxID=2528274 RepID=A0A932I455_UNCTE|nr:preprotein translocase subunit YajC [Candidatus Tectomicrobia bacterium]